MLGQCNCHCKLGIFWGTKTGLNCKVLPRDQMLNIYFVRNCNLLTRRKSLKYTQLLLHRFYLIIHFSHMIWLIFFEYWNLLSKFIVDNVHRQSDDITLEPVGTSHCWYCHVAVALFWFFWCELFMFLEWNLQKISLTHIGKSRKLFQKNGRWNKGYPGNFSQISQFWVTRQGILWKLFPGQFHEYKVISWCTHPSKNILTKRVRTARPFR